MCKVVDVSPKSYTLEVTGPASKLKAVIELLRPIGIKEITRTGTIAMMREKKTI
jgi:acetolactate synthase-1/3 small subunit